MKNFNFNKFWKVFGYIFGWFSDLESIILGITTIYITLIYSYNIAIDSTVLQTASIPNMLVFISGLEVLVWYVRLTVLGLALINRIFSYFARKRIVFSLIANLLYFYSAFSLLIHLDFKELMAKLLLWLTIIYFINTVFILKNLYEDIIKQRLKCLLMKEFKN